MSLVFRDASGNQTIIGASKSASKFRNVIAPAHSDFYFGEDTAAGNAPVDIGPAGTTISSGDASGHFQVNEVGGRAMMSLSTTGASAKMSGSPYTLTLSTAEQITVTKVASAITVDSTAELKALLESSSTAYGYSIFLREGSSYAGDDDIRAPAYSGGSYTGTWTPPSDGANHYDAPDLDGSNYVRVRAHTGESPVVGDRYELKGNGGSVPVRFTGITWNVIDAFDGSAIGMLQLEGCQNVAVDNCTFSASDVATNDETHRRNGIRLALGSCAGLKVIDCTFNNCWTGISSATNNDDLDVFGCTFRRAVNDGTNINNGSNIRWCWNFMIDKWRPASGAHPDFLQFSGVGSSSSCKNIWIIGNIHVRGAGKPGTTDGQGVFLDDIGTGVTYVQPVIVGNRTLTTYVNGIAILGADRASPDISQDAFIRNNTVMRDPTANSTTAALISLESPNSGADMNYNTWMNASDAPDNGTNIVLANVGEHDTFYAGGQAGTTDSAVGSTLAEVIANTNIKSGSSADTASPKVGAHQDYVDYVNRTLSLPYSLPTPVA